MKLPYSQINKLKPRIKNGTEVTLKISLNVVDDSSDENNFPHKFFLTNTQFLRLCKKFANNSLANIKLLKTQDKKTSRKIFSYTFGIITQIWLGFDTKLTDITSKKCFNPIKINSSCFRNRCMQLFIKNVWIW